MKRRAITDKDLYNFVKILHQWQVVTHGPLSWKSYIKHIESNTGYLYERTTLYKAKGGGIFREFQLTKERLNAQNLTKARGSTMSRQELLKAYPKQLVEIERLRSENTNLMRLHVKYLKLMFDNDIIPRDN